MKKKKWICTRSRLAGALMDAGIECESIRNPWRPEMTAWRLSITPKAVSIITAYYNEIGKPVPRSVLDYSAGCGGTANE